MLQKLFRTEVLYENINLCTAQQEDDDAHPEKHIVKPYFINLFQCQTFL